MSFLGIGPMELIFIIIIMILVLGPKNMITTAQKLGVTLRKIVKSPIWATVMDTSREIREIPTRLIREAGIEEDVKTIRSTTESIKNAGNVTVPYNVSASSKTKVSSKPEPTDSEISKESSKPAVESNEHLEKSESTPSTMPEQAKTDDKPVEN